MPIAAIGYFYLGNQLDDSILQTIDRVGGHSWISVTAQTLMTVHIILTVIFMINPVNQEAEKLMNIPPSE